MADAGHAPTAGRRLRSILGGAAGNLVEWYDWYAYSAFALYFAGAFFPKADQTAQLLNTAAVFAVGFVMRPVGDRLAIRDSGRVLRLPFDAILWVDAAGDYMCVHTATDTHVVRTTMHELEALLDPRRFQRIHRSTIVNLARVRELRRHLNGEYFLLLDSGQELKLSRSYKHKVKLLTGMRA